MTDNYTLEDVLSKNVKIKIFLHTQHIFKHSFGRNDS